MRYAPVICGPALVNPDYKEPLTIDLALLRSPSPRRQVPYLPISHETALPGTRVLMAGFPDDMELPFSVDQRLDLSGSEDDIARTRQRLRYARPRLMVKSGMIGHRGGVVLSDGKRTLQGEFIYIDNELQLGASGGPVVGADLRVVGIMTDRAITSVPFKETPQLRVPSGSTVAISPRMIETILDEQGA